MKSYVIVILSCNKVMPYVYDVICTEWLDKYIMDNFPNVKIDGREYMQIMGQMDDNDKEIFPNGFDYYGNEEYYTYKLFRKPFEKFFKKKSGWGEICYCPEHLQMVFVEKGDSKTNDILSNFNVY